MNRRCIALTTLACLPLALGGCYDSTGTDDDAGIVIMFDGGPRRDAGTMSGPDAGPILPRDAGPMIPRDASSPTREGAVGSGCEMDSDCMEPAGAVCQTTIGMGGFMFTLPGGYCSAMCMAGSDTCGEGAECFSVGFGGFGFALCVKSCFSDADCRTDEGYTCSMPPFIGGGPYCLPPMGMGGSDGGGFMLPDASFPFPDGGFSIPDGSFSIPDAGLPPVDGGAAPDAG